jgi:uncharacterized membrane protein
MPRHDMGRMMARWFQTLTIGALALAPFGLTLWIVWLLIQLAAFIGSLIARPVLSTLAQIAPGVEQLLESPLASVTIELFFALVILTLAGMFAGNIVGRMFGAFVGGLIQKIPIASVVYSSARQLIQSFQSPTEVASKVVLIEFPSEHMKAVGLVTRQFRASDTGEELAAVYVPTTPNPTSGYVEIVPVDRLIWLDWTTSEAIQFIVSAGVTAPASIRYRTSREAEAPRIDS